MKKTEPAQKSSFRPSKITSSKVGKLKVPKVKFVSNTTEAERAKRIELLKRWRTILSSPTFNYYLLWFLIFALSIIGLVMQFSATTILELSKGVTPYLGIGRPIVFLLLGFILLYIGMKIPPAWYEKLMWVVFGCALVLQCLVKTPLGRTQNGNTNWIIIPGTGQVIQPSEFLKISFVLLLASIFSRQLCDIRDIRSVLKWIVLPCIATMGAVLLGGDAGTMMIFITIVLAVVLVAGISIRWIMYAGGFLAVFLVIIVSISPSRIRRVLSFLPGRALDPRGSDLQPIRAK